MPNQQPPPGMRPEEWQRVKECLYRLLHAGRGEVVFVVRSKRIVKSQVTEENEWATRNEPTI